MEDGFVIDAVASTYTAKEACSQNRRFPVAEMVHAGSIYENQFETFEIVWKQRIDSSYSNHQLSLH